MFWIALAPIGRTRCICRYAFGVNVLFLFMSTTWLILFVCAIGHFWMLAEYISGSWATVGVIVCETIAMWWWNSNSLRVMAFCCTWVCVALNLQGLIFDDNLMCTIPSCERLVYGRCVKYIKPTMNVVPHVNLSARSSFGFEVERIAYQHKRPRLNSTSRQRFMLIHRLELIFIQLC